VWVVLGFFRFLGERGREALLGRKNLLLLQRVQGKKKMHSAIETIPF
jgi:hypothetical protein